MKKEITVGQVVGVAATLLIAIMSAWITLNNKVTRLETKQEQDRVEQYNLQIANDKKFDKMDNKIDGIQNDTRQILINLQNKQDRK